MVSSGVLVVILIASIAALVPSFALAQTAVLLAIPISFNEIVLSAIVGSGYATGGSESASKEKMRNTVVAWVLSFTVAIGASYGVYTVIETIL